MTTQKKHFAIWILLLGIALTFIACAKKEPVVAKVGRYQITVDDFKNGFPNNLRLLLSSFKNSGSAFLDNCYGHNC